MGSIGWDIVRTTLGALLSIRLSLTALVWRETDLIARHRETVIAISSVLALIGIPSRVIAKRVLVIARIAMGLAAAHVRNELATDFGATERLTRRLATI